MAEHIEKGPVDKDGNTTIRIWYDTPEEHPNFAEQGQAIELDPDRSYKRLLLVDLGASHALKFDASAARYVDMLHTLACTKLRPGTVYEIRSQVKSDYGRRRGVAWYTLAEMQQWPLQEAVPYPGEYNELGGYYTLGRFRTPDGPPGSN